MRLARPHPSVILYSLGCELGRQVGADILAPLYALVKALAGDALVRDNSGSGEAYGGLLNEFADYYDYHFYAELQFFRDLIDSFMPALAPDSAVGVRGVLRRRYVPRPAPAPEPRTKNQEPRTRY